MPRMNNQVRNRPCGGLIIYLSLVSFNIVIVFLVILSRYRDYNYEIITCMSISGAIQMGASCIDRYTCN